MTYLDSSELNEEQREARSNNYYELRDWLEEFGDRVGYYEFEQYNYNNLYSYHNTATFFISTLCNQYDLYPEDLSVVAFSLEDDGCSYTLETGEEVSIHLYAEGTLPGIADSHGNTVSCFSGEHNAADGWSVVYAVTDEPGVDFNPDGMNIIPPELVALVEDSEGYDTADFCADSFIADILEYNSDLQGNISLLYECVDPENSYGVVALFCRDTHLIPLAEALGYVLSEALSYALSEE